MHSTSLCPVRTSGIGPLQFTWASCLRGVRGPWSEKLLVSVVPRLPHCFRAAALILSDGWVPLRLEVIPEPF